MSPAPKLLDRVRDAVRTRHYSRRTEEAYVHWIRRYIVFHGKAHPSTLGAEAISAFLTWLAVQRNVSASTQNQALSALLFLYRQVLEVAVGTARRTASLNSEWTAIGCNFGHGYRSRSASASSHEDTQGSVVGSGGSSPIMT
jgi:hypothetical protein